MVDILGSPCIQVDSYIYMYASVVQRQDLVKANKTEQNLLAWSYGDS